MNKEDEHINGKTVSRKSSKENLTLPDCDMRTVSSEPTMAKVDMDLTTSVECLKALSENLEPLLPMTVSKEELEVDSYQSSGQITKSADETTLPDLVKVSCSSQTMEDGDQCENSRDLEAKNEVIKESIFATATENGTLKEVNQTLEDNLDISGQNGLLTIKSDDEKEQDDQYEESEEEGPAFLDKSTQTAFNKDLVLNGSCNYFFWMDKVRINKLN